MIILSGPSPLLIFLAHDVKGTHGLFLNKWAYIGHFHKITNFLHDLVILEVSIFQIPVFICQPGDQKYFSIFGEFDGLYIINAFHTLEGPSRSTLNQFH